MHGVRNRAGLETRDRILDAAKSVLAARGLDGLTVKAICDLAEIRAGSFYNLFRSKEQVVLTVVREAINAVDPDLYGSGDSSLSDLVNAYIRFVVDQPVLARVYLTIALSGGLTDPDLGQRILRHHRERHLRFSQALLRDREGLAESIAMERSEALLAALNGYAFHAVIDAHFDFGAHARRLLSMEPAP